MMQHEEIPIEKIKWGERYRQDQGDIEGLAANIREMGLLQPIGVDSYYQLIFGERRLIACGQILGWKTIPAVVLKLESVLAGEYAENEFRKAFTPSERADIGKAIEEELGDRRGQRTDQLVEKIPLVEPGKKTRDIAAAKAGFGNAHTYEQAKSVTERGATEVVAAMDRGDLSISAAAVIASQPQDDQKRILEMPKDQQREVVRSIRKSKADREADEQRARDIRLFRGLYDAVKFIAMFCEEPSASWAGLWRVSAYDFAEHLTKAEEYLNRLQRSHPNEKARFRQ